MPTRQSTLNQWLEQILNHNHFTLSPLAGDASFRRYFRLHDGQTTYVVMDAPPDKENMTPFITIGNLLRNRGIHTPEIRAIEPEQGFLLLEDLGDRLLLQELTTTNANTLYTMAIDTLLQLQQAPTEAPLLPVFDSAFMRQELSLFRDWFLTAYLNLELNTSEEQCLHDTFAKLATEIMQQPQTFIHRDYHSRNIMLLGNSLPPDALGVIDFQDAMQGPFAYDLVSLLKDCYIQWPKAQLTTWLTYFHQHQTHHNNLSLAELTRAFDWCGLQRHLKVLGIFCRLSLRDNKPAYLPHLPLTYHYVETCLETYPEFLPFYKLLQRKVTPLFKEKHP